MEQSALGVVLQAEMKVGENVALETVSFRLRYCCFSCNKHHTQPDEINNTSCIRRSWMTSIRIIFSFVLLTVIVSYLGSNMVLASSPVTQLQAKLIEWCTKEMVRVTDASMVQALNYCAEYYLKGG
jgi:hypothetical protein